ncbi:hypothetical protein TNCV_71221 [Trichonephila clavipes]|nr:hypothetical protein TNCV_71221 [Trichonephila clavipes]
MGCELIISHYRPTTSPGSWYHFLVRCLIGGYQSPQWIATLTAVPSDFGSNPREGMNVCALAAWGYSKSRRASSPLGRLVEGEERWEAPDHSRVFSLKVGEEPS